MWWVKAPVFSYGHAQTSWNIVSLLNPSQTPSAPSLFTTGKHTPHVTAHTGFPMRENWDLCSPFTPARLCLAFLRAVWRLSQMMACYRIHLPVQSFQYFQSVACNCCVARTVSAQVSLYAAVMMLEPEKYNLQPCAHLNPNMWCLFIYFQRFVLIEFLMNIRLLALAFFFFLNYIFNQDQTWASSTWLLQCTVANSVVHWDSCSGIILKQKTHQKPPNKQTIKKIYYWFKCDWDNLVYLQCYSVFLKILWWLFSWSFRFSALLIILVLSIFSASGCASLHHRSLKSMLILLNCAGISRGFVHQAGVEMFMMPLFQGRTGRCSLLSCPLPSPQFISGQLSFHIAWQPRWYSRSLGLPPHTPNRQSCFQVPLNTQRSRKMTPLLDCSLWYLLLGDLADQAIFQPAHLPGWGSPMRSPLHL